MLLALAHLTKAAALLSAVLWRIPQGKDLKVSNQQPVGNEALTNNP